MIEVAINRAVAVPIAKITPSHIISVKDLFSVKIVLFFGDRFFSWFGDSVNFAFFMFF
tara:strand:- start:622 stop:795 length:174 start_codon:yes stop_codon:yes gene_type:complete